MYYAWMEDRGADAGSSLRLDMLEASEDNLLLEKSLFCFVFMSSLFG